MVVYLTTTMAFQSSTISIADHFTESSIICIEESKITPRHYIKSFNAKIKKEQNINAYLTGKWSDTLKLVTFVVPQKAFKSDRQTSIWTEPSIKDQIVKENVIYRSYHISK